MRFVLIIALVLSQRPTPSSGKGKGQPPKSQTAEHQQPTGQTASTTPALAPPPAHGRPDNRAYSGDRKPTPDWWMIGLTGGLLLVAGFQAWLFLRQLGIMDGSLSDTKKAADAAKEAADATKESVATMKETAERQLRAYGVR